MDTPERQGKNITLVCLDWQKAFDKVDQRRLVEVLQRLHTLPNILQTIRNIYENAQFRVVKGESRVKTNPNTRLKKLESDKDAHSAHTCSALCYLLCSKTSRLNLSHLSGKNLSRG